MKRGRGAEPDSSRKTAKSEHAALSATRKEEKVDAKAPKGYSSSVHCVGAGSSGQLGLGDVQLECDYLTPMREFSAAPIIKLAAGGMHTAAIDGNGECWTWGCNDEHALGRTSGDDYVPGRVSVPPGVCFTDVACGDSHTIALDQSGKVYSWGLYRDHSGPIGYSETKSHQLTPCLVPLPKNVVAIACGDHHDVALTSAGDVYEWGNVSLGKRSSDRQKLKKLNPQRVSFSKRAKTKKPLRMVAIFAGGHTTFATDQDGQVWAWGPNNYGQCGIRAETRDKKEGPALAATSELFVATPAPVALDLLGDGERIVKIASATHHTLFLSDAGRLYAVGKGAFGRLGTGDCTDRDVGTRITFFDTLSDGDRVVDISCGNAHSLATTREGRVYAWGFGDLMQLGTGRSADECVPSLVARIGTRHRAICARGGAEHTVVLAVEQPGYVPQAPSQSTLGPEHSSSGSAVASPSCSSCSSSSSSSSPSSPSSSSSSSASSSSSSAKHLHLELLTAQASLPDD